MEYVKGESREQALLFPEYIEDYIDENNATRVIDAFIKSLDLEALGFAKTELKDKTGRPPYDPQDLLKLYVYGYINRIRSSRRLETESKRNLEVIWLLRKLRPDHKTIARFRHDNAKALKGAFRDFVKLCVRLDLYGKGLAAIDGGKFKAVNSTARNFTEEKLQKRIDKINEHIQKYLEELEKIDVAEDTADREKRAGEITGIVKKLDERKEQYQGYAKELEETGEKQKSLTDSDSRLMLTHGTWDVCYNVQAAVDAKNKLIAEFEVSNQGNDKNFITPMAASMKETLGVENIAAVADTGYESTLDILAAREQGIDVHVAGTDFDVCVPSEEGEQGQINSQHNGRCAYIAGRNIALCPMGNVLYPASHRKQKGYAGQAIFYNKTACRQCACKCAANDKGYFEYPVHMAKDDFSKEYNDQGLAVKQIRIKADTVLVKKRKAIVEHIFGTVKRGMDAGYCLTRGLQKVSGEFALAFLAYNIKRAINILGCNKLIAAMT